MTVKVLLYVLLNSGGMTYREGRLSRSPESNPLDGGAGCRCCRSLPGNLLSFKMVTDCAQPEEILPGGTVKTSKKCPSMI